MRVHNEYVHNFSDLILKEKGAYEAIYDLLEQKDVRIMNKGTTIINERIKKKLTEEHWVIGPSVDVEFNLKINAMKNSIGLTVQTGNISRAFYDLLKFQAMKDSGKIDVAVLVVPTSAAAKILNSNVASFTRVTNEILLFKRIINVPCLILGLDE